MRSPGRSDLPRHRAPSAAARVRAYAARVRGRTGRGLRGPDDVLTGLDDARPRRARSSRGRRISPALRRLVVTPTFAAGLGVVVAAFLAANMSRTVLHFSAPIPGNQCTAGDCHAQPHGGQVASARPGVHITPRGPASSGPVTAVQPGGGQPSGNEPGGNEPSGSEPGGGQSGGSQPGGSQSGSSQPGGSQPGADQPGGTAPAAGDSGGLQPSVGGRAVSITYQQVEQWPGGFADQITIRGLSGSGTQAWSLSFAYPGSRIAAVQGARWEPGRTGAGAAQGVWWPGWGQPHQSAAPVRLTVIVEGQPAPPSSCAFDGQLCTFGGRATP
jgi:hypothetical protein